MTVFYEARIFYMTQQPCLSVAILAQLQITVR